MLGSREQIDMKPRTPERRLIGLDDTINEIVGSVMHERERGMIRTSHLLVVVLLVFGVAAAALVPGGSAEAAVVSVSYTGDCAGVQVTV